MMKTKQKGFAYLLFIVLLTGVLAGCGTEGNGGSVPPEPTKNVEEGNVPTDMPREETGATVTPQTGTTTAPTAEPTPTLTPTPTLSPTPTPTPTSTPTPTPTSTPTPTPISTADWPVNAKTGLFEVQKMDEEQQNILIEYLMNFDLAAYLDKRYESMVFVERWDFSENYAFASVYQRFDGNKVYCTTSKDIYLNDWVEYSREEYSETEAYMVTEGDCTSTYSTERGYENTSVWTKTQSDASQDSNVCKFYIPDCVTSYQISCKSGSDGNYYYVSGEITADKVESLLKEYEFEGVESPRGEAYWKFTMDGMLKEMGIGIYMAQSSMDCIIFTTSKLEIEVNFESVEFVRIPEYIYRAVGEDARVAPEIIEKWTDGCWETKGYPKWKEQNGYVLITLPEKEGWYYNNLENDYYDGSSWLYVVDEEYSTEKARYSVEYEQRLAVANSDVARILKELNWLYGGELNFDSNNLHSFSINGRDVYYYVDNQGAADAHGDYIVLQDIGASHFLMFSIFLDEKLTDDERHKFAQHYIEMFALTTE